MSIQSIHYSVPKTLMREQELVEAKCNLLIEAFNQLCKEETKRLDEEKQKALTSRVFVYSVKEIGYGWKVLYKEAEVPVGVDNDKQWSIPFMIINGVLIHRDHAYNGKSWMNANALIPQGLFDKNIDEINKDW